MLFTFFRLAKSVFLLFKKIDIKSLQVLNHFISMFEYFQKLAFIKLGALKISEYSQEQENTCVAFSF